MLIKENKSEEKILQFSQIMKIWNVIFRHSISHIIYNWLKNNLWKE